MTTKTDANYKAKVGGARKHRKQKHKTPETIIKIKQEKSIKSEPVNDYQDSEIDPKKIKTEPGTSGLHHRGKRRKSSKSYACMDLDPYSDDVIFMGMGTSKKSQFCSELFKLNFSIKTEKKDYFVTPDGVCIINDDDYEERAPQLDDNNNFSVIDLTNDEDMTETKEKAVKQDKDKDETNLTTNKVKDLNQDDDKKNEKEATKDQTSTEENTEEETSTASKTTRDEMEDQTAAKNKTQPNVTKNQTKATDNRNKPAFKNQTERNLMLKRIGTVYKNGKHHYLRYVKEYLYGQDFILVYVEEEDCIRMFKQDFEPNYFYKAFYDLVTSPRYKPPQWIANLMHYYMVKALKKNKQDHEYMKTFKFNPKMVLHNSCLLWKVTEKNNRGIVVQDLNNCECIEIHDQNDFQFSQLDKIFQEQQNSHIVDHHTYFNSMRRNFFYQIMS